MPEEFYQQKVHMNPGGDELLVESGGLLTIKTGGSVKFNGVEAGPGNLAGLTASVAELNKLTGAGALVASGTQAGHVAALKINYTAGDLDTEAEIITALNATNAALNQIMADITAFKIRAAA